MKMTISNIIVLLIICSGMTLFSAFVIGENPQARSDGNAIIVTWSMLDESGVQYYQVLRRYGGNSNFDVVAPSISKRGINYTYTYRDQSVFKTEDGYYEYKIRIITGQNPAPETRIASVSHLSSTAKRTWGSIKAMFR